MTFKPFAAALCTIVCCMGNEMPAQAGLRWAQIAGAQACASVRAGISHEDAIEKALDHVIDTPALRADFLEFINGPHFGNNSVRQTAAQMHLSEQFHQNCPKFTY